MTIHNLAISVDPQELPVVSWIEDRNQYAPDGYGQVAISCFLRLNKATQRLEFVAHGKVRFGAELEAEPWSDLDSFSVQIGERIYESPERQVMTTAIVKKIPWAEPVLRDDAKVMIATFRPSGRGVGHMMHLNCATATTAEVDRLQSILEREFLHKRDDITKRLLKLDRERGDHLWPHDKPFVEYKPANFTSHHKWMVRLVDMSLFGIFAGLAYAFYWFLIR